MDTKNQIHDEVGCISGSANILEKGMNPTILPLATKKLRLKIKLVSHAARAEQLVNMYIYIYIYIYISYLPIPSARAGYDTRSIFKQSLTVLNSEFSFS